MVQINKFVSLPRSNHTIISLFIGIASLWVASDLVNRFILLANAFSNMEAGLLNKQNSNFLTALIV